MRASVYPSSIASENGGVHWEGNVIRPVHAIKIFALYYTGNLNLVTLLIRDISHLDGVKGQI
jgi:hypothetical protein